MRPAAAAAIAAIMLVAGAGFGFLVGTGTTQSTQTLFTTVTTSVIVTTFSSTLTMSVYVTNSVFVTKTAVGTTGYYVANVTDDMNVLSEGYIYILNKSVNFEGVTFTTLCPGIIPCDDQSTVTRIAGIPSAGWIELQMVFPDGKNETLVNNVGSSDYTVLLSQHANPTAGIELQYVAKTSQYEAFLLVSQ
jgi:hypothetical protein